VEKGFSVRGERAEIGSISAWISIAILCALAHAGCDVDRSKHGRNPRKIVALTPAAAEIVVALGAADRLIGEEARSTFPPSVNSPLEIGDEIHSLADLRTAIAAIGARIGRRAEANAVLATIDEEVAGSRKRQRGRNLRVLIVIAREPGGLGNMIAAAKGSWLDDLFAITGAENVLATATVRYPTVSPDELLRAKPDVILDVSPTVDRATALAAWQPMREIPAVATGRVKIMMDAYLRHPSPRVAEALAAIESALAPP
jgi:iron complex transport system substrate-binding protein